MLWTTRWHKVIVTVKEALPITAKSCAVNNISWHSIGAIIISWNNGCHNKLYVICTWCARCVGGVHWTWLTCWCTCLSLDLTLRASSRMLRPATAPTLSRWSVPMAPLSWQPVTTSSGHPPAALPDGRIVLAKLKSRCIHVIIDKLVKWLLLPGSWLVQDCFPASECETIHIRVGQVWCI